MLQSWRGLSCVRELRANDTLTGRVAAAVTESHPDRFDKSVEDGRERSRIGIGDTIGNNRASGSDCLSCS